MLLEERILSYLSSQPSYTSLRQIGSALSLGHYVWKEVRKLELAGILVSIQKGGGKAKYYKISGGN